MSTNKVDWAAEVQSAVLAMKEEGQKAYTFMKQEAPEVAREYIVWSRANTAVEFGAYLAAAGLVCLIARSLWTKKPETVVKYGQTELQDMDGYRTGAVVLFIGVAGIILAAGLNVPRILKPWLAPRIAVIEGIKEVVR